MHVIAHGEDGVPVERRTYAIDDATHNALEVSQRASRPKRPTYSRPPSGSRGEHLPRPLHSADTSEHNMIVDDCRSFAHGAVLSTLCEIVRL